MLLESKGDMAPYGKNGHERREGARPQEEGTSVTFLKPPKSPMTKARQLHACPAQASCACEDGEGPGEAAGGYCGGDGHGQVRCRFDITAGRRWPGTDADHRRQLAVEVARRFNGEVVNGDAMQLYKGLPVITNKITSDEMKGVPHHLLGCIGLEEETWTVGRFVGRALAVIDEIRSRGKLPILVGGTHYYTQALLFEDALTSEPGLDLDDDRSFPILDGPTEGILERLREVDPVMAGRWHPNDRRKIQRSLEIYLRTGKPASQVYDEQRLRRELPSDLDDPHFDSYQHGSLRFPTLILWVYASKEALSPRLDARILKMLDRGLLSEVSTLSTFESRSGVTIDQSRGIWVSIGYKEFLDYQSALFDNTSTEEQMDRLKVSAIERTQAATRQYAKRQIRWLRIKLLNALPPSTPSQPPTIFLLDGSSLPLWDSHVLGLAHLLTKTFLSGADLPDPSTLSDAAAEMLTPKRDYDLAQRPDLWQKRVCETWMGSL